MTRKILVVFAHPEPTSLTRQLVDVTAETLAAQGHEVVQSDLYGMRWKAVFDADDFPSRTDRERLSFIHESLNAYSNGRQTDDVVAEQTKLSNADAVVLQFPLWWFGAPAILKGWIERVYAFGFGYGYGDGTNNYRYGDGALKGKGAGASLHRRTGSGVWAARRSRAARTVAISAHAWGAVLSRNGCASDPCRFRRRPFQFG